VLRGSEKNEMTSVEYRRAVLSDVPRLIGLPKPGEAGGDARMALYLAGEHHPQHALSSRAIWLAEAGHEPVGYIAGHLTRRFGCAGELQWIYVVPDERRRGVASRLLELLAAWFLEQDAHRVCVDIGDDAARPFYRRYGATDLNPHWMIWQDIAVVANRGRSGDGLRVN
jgi:GNAT superfamily N-acetyltransferase